MGLKADPEQSSLLDGNNPRQYPTEQGLRADVEQSVTLYHEIMEDPQFGPLLRKGGTEAKKAVEGFMNAMGLDERGSLRLGSQRYNNFAAKLVEQYRTSTQKDLRKKLGDMYSLMLGDEGSMFPVEGMSYKDAIKKIFGIDYNGKELNDLLGSDDAGGQGGERDRAGGNPPGEPKKKGEGPADTAGGDTGKPGGDVTPKETSAEEPKPIGKGPFGDIYDQFKGKPKEAFDFLLKKRSGHLKGVFHRDEIGDIDLIWGDAPSDNRGKGLAHIIRKHVEAHTDFASEEEAARVITDVVENGVVQKDGNA